MAAPHPVLRGLWRAAGGPAAAMRALTAPERGLRSLTTDGFAALVTTPELAPLLDPFAAEDAVSGVLRRLRRTEAAVAVSPTPRRAPGQPVQEAGANPDQAAQPAMAASRPALAAVEGIAAPQAGHRGPMPGVPSPTRGRPVARTLPDTAPRAKLPQPAPMPATRHGVAMALASEAARRPIAGAAPNAARRQAVALLLDGIQPPDSTMLAALDEGDASPMSAAQRADPLEDKLLRLLGRVEVARHGAAWTRAPEADRRGPAAAPMDAAASSFRRLTARFAGRDAQGPRPGYDAMPAGFAAAGMPGPAVTADAPPDSIATILPRTGVAAATDAEFADRLARVLRRAARHQGIPDEGGAG